MDDKLNFLGGQAAGEPEAVHEAPVAETPPGSSPGQAPPEPAEPPSQPRGSDGKFQPKEAPGSSPGQAPAPDASPKQPPLTEKETVGFYKAMQEERDRRQAAEAKARELEARIAAQTAPAQASSLAEQTQAALYAQNLAVSKRFAEREHGKEEVAKVHEWAAAKCDADPHFNQLMLSSQDPYEAAMAAFNAERVASEVSPKDLDAFRSWKASQAQNPIPPVAAQAAPPRSLATASGTGAAGASHVPTHPGAAFEAAIK